MAIRDVDISQKIIEEAMRCLEEVGLDISLPKKDPVAVKDTLEEVLRKLKGLELVVQEARVRGFLSRLQLANGRGGGGREIG